MVPRDCTVEATFSPTHDHQSTDDIFVCTSPKKPPQDSRKWLDQVRPLGVFLRLGTDVWTLGIRIGLNKGYETTAIPKRVKPSQLKGRLSKKTQFVRSVVREVVGFAPYERRVLELLRNSKVSILRSLTYDSHRSHYVHLVQDKKARKLTKKRVFRSPPPFDIMRCIGIDRPFIFFCVI